MRFRPGESADIPALARLWTDAFPGERSTADRMDTLESGGPHGGIETVFLAESDDVLLGACRLIPCRQILVGSDISMLGLAAVAVSPGARRRGVASELCRRALAEGVSRGHLASVLFPFRPAFYRRLGWGLVGELQSFRFLPESLPEAGDPMVEPGGPADEPAVAACYERVARGSNGLLIRDEVLWRKHLEAPATQLLVARVAGGIGGYLLARYGRKRTSDRGTLHVRELVAEDEAAYGRLLGWISAQRDVWRRVRYDASPDENFAHRLADPRPPGYRPARHLWAESARVIRGPMLRILDVRAAIEQRRQWGAVAPFSFELQVEDRELPANRGPHRFEFDGARVGAARGASVSARLRVGPSVMAQIWSGEIGVEAAAGMGLGSGDGDLAALDALFRPGRAFRILDEF